MSLNHVGNVQPSIDKEEHYHVGGVETGAGAKKVVVLDGDGNQVTSFGSDVSDLATSAKQDDIITELQKKRNYEYMGKVVDSGYNYFLFKEVNSTLWKVLRISTTDASDVAYAYGTNGWAAIKADPTTGSYGDPPDS